MKKSILKFLTVVCFIAFSGCDSYLDEDPIGLITKDRIDTEPTAASIISSVNSTYQLLSRTLNVIGQWNWDQGTITRNDFLLQDIASGDMQKKWNPDGDQAWMDEVAAFNFTSMNPGFNGIWSYDYEGISRANQAITTLNNSEVMSSVDMDGATKDRLLGEVYFLRAFYYFDLVNNFGGVPLLTEPLQDFSDAYQVAKRSTQQEIWAQITADPYWPNKNIPAMLNRGGFLSERQLPCRQR